MKSLSPVGLPTLEVAAGATTPNPGYAAIIWSSTTNGLLWWNGTQWEGSSGGAVIPALFPVSFAGAPTASQLIARIALPVAIVFPANFAGAVAAAPVAEATASTTFTVKNGSTTIGTIVRSAGETTFTTTGGTAVTCALGSYLDIVAPSVADATFNGLFVTLIGTRS